VGRKIRPTVASNYNIRSDNLLALVVKDDVFMEMFGPSVLLLDHCWVSDKIGWTNYVNEIFNCLVKVLLVLTVLVI